MRRYLKLRIHGNFSVCISELAVHGLMLVSGVNVSKVITTSTATVSALQSLAFLLWCVFPWCSNSWC